MLRCGEHTPHLLRLETGAYLAGFYDGLVAGAATQIAIQALHKVLWLEFGAVLLCLGHSCMTSHYKAWCAVAALRGMMLAESLCMNKMR